MCKCANSNSCHDYFLFSLLGVALKQPDDPDI